MYVGKRYGHRFFGLLSSIFLALITLPAHAGFLGQTVHADYLFPDSATVFADLGNAVVGAGTEFSTTLNPPAVSAAVLLNADLSDTDILINLSSPGATFTSSFTSFNGLHFFDAFGSIAQIINVTIASTNNFGFDDSGLNFDDDNIYLNFSSLEVTQDSSLTLNVEFARTAVPEPISMLLLGTGLVALGMTRRKK